jgi:hypothetical protein
MLTLAEIWEETDKVLQRGNLKEVECISKNGDDFIIPTKCTPQEISEKEVKALTDHLSSREAENAFSVSNFSKHESGETEAVV